MSPLMPRAASPNATMGSVPPSSPGRVALICEHRYPYTVGGAQRFYGTLGESWAAERPVTYLTRRFWPGAARREEDGVELVGLSAVRGSGAGPLRRGLAKGLFALAVGWHLARHGGRYAVVHCSCFPHLVLLAARIGLALRPGTLLVADWHEVLPRATWRRRLGRVGELGYLAQRLVVGAGRGAITFSRLHERRLHEEGRHDGVFRVPEFPTEQRAPIPGPEPEREELIVFAGRLVDEKRAHLVPAVLAELRRRAPGYRAEIFGAGPDEERVRRAAEEHGVADAVALRGFAPWEELSLAMRRAGALVFPSEREGFGLVVIEAAAHGLPVVLTAGEDNASTELVEDGRNGVVCATADPAEQAEAVLALAARADVHTATADWFAEAAERYSVESCRRELERVHAAVGGRG